MQLCVCLVFYPVRTHTSVFGYVCAIRRQNRTFSKTQSQFEPPWECVAYVHHADLNLQRDSDCLRARLADACP
jgi:hypothetical protein